MVITEGRDFIMSDLVVSDSYECTICGCHTTPAEGDPRTGHRSGTSFEDLPDDWVCPECGASKEDFVMVE